MAYIFPKNSLEYKEQCADSYYESVVMVACSQYHADCKLPALTCESDLVEAQVIISWDDYFDACKYGDN